VLLGLFPLLARKIVEGSCKSARSTRAGRQVRPAHALTATWWSSVPAPAGLVSAYIAAAVKAKVTLVEAHKMGGDCLNYGCVPSKALIRSAKLAHQMRHGSRYGLADSTAGVQLQGGDGSASTT
jgi:hypothetical protein